MSDNWFGDYGDSTPKDEDNANDSSLGSENVQEETGANGDVANGDVQKEFEGVIDASSSDVSAGFDAKLATPSNADENEIETQNKGENSSAGVEPDKPLLEDDAGGAYRFGVNAPNQVPAAEVSYSTPQTPEQPNPQTPPSEQYSSGQRPPVQNSYGAPQGRPFGYQQQGQQNQSPQQGQPNQPNPQQGQPNQPNPNNPYSYGNYGQQNPQNQQYQQQGGPQQQQQGGPQQQQQQYQPPGYGAPGGYPYQQNGYYGQKPMPTYKKKGPNALIVALSVLCVVAVIVAATLRFYDLNKNDKPAIKDSSSTSSSSSNSTGDSDSSFSENPDAPAIDIEGNPDGGDGLTTADIVEKNVDSTVVINLYEVAYDEFRGEDTETIAGSGSGIVWTKDGYIITNAHVVHNEKTGKRFSRIEVVFYDGTKVDNATVVGADTATDLALLSVDKKDLNVAEFGDTAKLRLGDRVIALGNAGGLSWTVTQGILSGKNREIYTDNYSISCIQTDAAINPGNSGGPLLNKYGQVIGINSAKYTNADNLGFAIPMEEAKRVIDDLAKYGYPKGRVRLGITGREYQGIGFRVESIAADSCLVGTDAKTGDIIISIGGVDVYDHATLNSELKKFSVGDSVEVKFMKTDRSRAEYTVSVVLPEAKG